MQALLLAAGVVGAGLAAALAQFDDGFAPVTRPNENEAVANGATFEIAWLATAPEHEDARVRLVLQAADDDEEPKVTIAGNVVRHQMCWAPLRRC